MTGMKDAVELNCTETAARCRNLLAEQRCCWANLLAGKTPELSKSLCKSTCGVMSKFLGQPWKPNQCGDVEMPPPKKPLLC